MRDVIIIGGGLSGLAAAYELEQHNVYYTLIEVKSRLGGSVLSVEHGGFVMDGGAFAFPRPAHWQTLHDLGMTDALFEVQTPRERQRVAFKSGTQTLTDALADRLTGTIIQRMAVTSVGANDSGGYRVCLENGLALDTRAVVIAVPARYAERILRPLSADVSAALANYHYDDVTRVTLGFDPDTRPQKLLHAPPNITFAELTSTEHPSRVPPGGLLVQTAVRFPLERTTPEALLLWIRERMGWKQPPAWFVHRWQEAYPLSVTGNPERYAALNDNLPPGVALSGSCYRVLTLPERTEVGRSAAQAVLATL